MTIKQLLDQDLVTDNALRRELGRQHMSSVMIYLLDRNGWSHPDFEHLAEFALNEKGAIHSSQVSHIRNSKMRMMGVKSLDAFGAINLAVWAYNNDKASFRKMGCATVTEKIELLIKDKIAICDPETGAPLDAGGWMNLYLGYLKIEEVSGLSGGEAEITTALADAVRAYLSREIQKTGKPIHTVAPIAKSAIKNPDTVTKIMQAVVGLGALDPDELTDMLPDIYDLLNTLDGRDRTPSTVLTEAAT
ncbi:predicted protein [Cyanophage PSS2]|uniref:hypothetical protein n=1 Tax=Cyanophage PSS2 TaxID=658401 RepID=UPI0001B0403E|nr:hypothetical protein PSS2_gp103 [Cyanophage PSS2]ACT65665.1 hypothetical protein [Cyanophage PSS2]ACY75807.1 predicted protein [Cyanophage PSS2]